VLVLDELLDAVQDLVVGAWVVHGISRWSCRSVAASLC
jgi:hypothetical protein